MGVANSKADWKAHPRFTGVFVKALVTAAENPGLALNLVRLPPGGEITPHVHSDSTETFYILSGNGVTWIGGEEIHLAPGVCGYAEPQVTHSLCNTGNTDLEAISIFNPPLG